MEEIEIWEQYTVTLNRDPRKGFGIAISGGRDRPNAVDEDTSIFISDVVSGGPADGRLHVRDKIVMVNGHSMENVSSSFAIQTLRTCGNQVNITIKRPRKVQLPITKFGIARNPGRRRSRSTRNHNRGYEGDSSSERSSGRVRGEADVHRRPPTRNRRRSRPRESVSSCSSQGASASGLTLMSGFKRLPQQHVPSKPICSVLRKNMENQEYGLRLGSLIFIKHITETGLATRWPGRPLLTRSVSLRLIEQSEGRLTLHVLHNKNQLLLNIPDVQDSESDSSPLDVHSFQNEQVVVVVVSHEVVSDPSQPHGQHSSRPSCPPPSPESTQAHTHCFSDPIQPPHPLPSPSSFAIYCSHPLPKIVRFIKARNIGLRLTGGNEVGIFVASVQEGSPAEMQGIQEGDQILQVNERLFLNLTREEAVQYLMDLRPGEEVELHTQNKLDAYRKIVKSTKADSFYIRTHFDFEKETPSGLSFTRGEVFHVVDTMYRGKMGCWLAWRMGKDFQETDKGIIPNKSRAEQIASQESALKSSQAASTSSGNRAEFWKFRGLRGAKKTLWKSREDLSVLTKQGRFPPYERVVLKKATFKRPVVILGPIADIAMHKLNFEMPDQFEVAGSVFKDDGLTKVIKLETVWEIARQDKHALLDITPVAVERLRYIQYFPIVIFCEPESRQGVKAMRKWLAPESKKSSRRLFAQATKMRKYCSHLFTATISLAGSSDSWYQSLKEIIWTEQGQLVWMSEEKVGTSSRGASKPHSLPSAIPPGYLTCESHINSDYEETDTEGELFTDPEMEEGNWNASLMRSSEPTQEDLSDPLGGVRSNRPKMFHSIYDSVFLFGREFGRKALQKKFSQAYDSDSDQESCFGWGPATDL
uniref:Tight junction protein 3 n=1 Tax=Varanus komodoensis TaxID=61221 RepID=A0A8D2LAK0_VARKO